MADRACKKNHVHVWGDPSEPCPEVVHLTTLDGAAACILAGNPWAAAVREATALGLRVGYAGPNQPLRIRYQDDASWVEMELAVAIQSAHYPADILASFYVELRDRAEKRDSARSWAH